MKTKIIPVTIIKDIDYIFTDKAVAGAGDLTLDGVGTRGGKVEYPEKNGYRVVCTSTGNASGVNFTIYGKDIFGNDTTDVVQGTNGGFFTGAVYFSTIDRIAADGTTGIATVQFGNDGSHISRPVVLNGYAHSVTVSVFQNISDHFWTVKHTFQNPWDSPLSVDNLTSSTQWPSVTSLANQENVSKSFVFAADSAEGMPTAVILEVTTAGSNGGTTELRVQHHGE